MYEVIGLKGWAPYVANYGQSEFLLDHFACHKSEAVREIFKSNGNDVELIPGKYMSVLQPCEVGRMKSLKHGIKKHYMK